MIGLQTRFVADKGHIPRQEPPCRVRQVGEASTALLLMRRCSYYRPSRLSNRTPAISVGGLDTTTPCAFLAHHTGNFVNLGHISKHCSWTA